MWEDGKACRDLAAAGPLRCYAAVLFAARSLPSSLSADDAPSLFE
jgi:hypothetical protein